MGRRVLVEPSFLSDKLAISFFFFEIFFFFAWCGHFVKCLLNVLQYCFYFMSFGHTWGMWDCSFQTRDGICSSLIGKGHLNHWTVREVPYISNFSVLLMNHSHNETPQNCEAKLWTLEYSSQLDQLGRGNHNILEGTEGWERVLMLFLLHNCLELGENDTQASRHSPWCLQRPHFCLFNLQ